MSHFANLKIQRKTYGNTVPFVKYVLKNVTPSIIFFVYFLILLAYWLLLAFMSTVKSIPNFFIYVYDDCCVICMLMFTNVKSVFDHVTSQANLQAKPAVFTLRHKHGSKKKSPFF